MQHLQDAMHRVEQHKAYSDNYVKLIATDARIPFDQTPVYGDRVPVYLGTKADFNDPRYVLLFDAAFDAGTVFVGMSEDDRCVSYDWVGAGRVWASNTKDGHHMLSIAGLPRWSQSDGHVIHWVRAARADTQRLFAFFPTLADADKFLAELAKVAQQPTAPIIEEAGQLGNLTINALDDKLADGQWAARLYVPDCEEYDYLWVDADGMWCVVRGELFDDPAWADEKIIDAYGGWVDGHTRATPVQFVKLPVRS